MPTYQKDYTPIYNRFNASNAMTPEIQDQVYGLVGNLIAVMDSNNFNPREFQQYVSDLLYGRCSDRIIRNAMVLRKEERAEEQKAFEAMNKIGVR